MAYKAKKPRKKGLRVKIEKCWYISIVDETDTEIGNDYCFLDRKEAEKAGQILKRNLEEALAEKPSVNPAMLIFTGMNSIGSVEFSQERTV